MGDSVSKQVNEWMDGENQACQQYVCVCVCTRVYVEGRAG